MTKKIIIATVAIFVLWFVMDWVIHGVLLMPTYNETASLWRPMEEFKPWLMWIVNAVSIACLVSIYAYYINGKSIRTGVVYGLLLGIAYGAGMGFGTYSYMPIPYVLAQGWFWASIAEIGAAGFVMALIVKE